MAGLMMLAGGSGLGALLAGGGTILSTMGAISEGRSQQRAASFQAAQLDQQANAERSAGVEQF